MNLDIFSSNDPLATLNDCSNWRESCICLQFTVYEVTLFSLKGKYWNRNSNTKKKLPLSVMILLLTNQESAGG